MMEWQSWLTTRDRQIFVLTSRLIEARAPLHRPFLASCLECLRQKEMPRAWNSPFLAWPGVLAVCEIARCRPGVHCGPSILHPKSVTPSTWELPLHVEPQPTTPTFQVLNTSTTIHQATALATRILRDGFEQHQKAGLEPDALRHQGRRAQDAKWWVIFSAGCCARRLC